MNYKIKVYRHFEKEVKKLSKRYKSLKQDLTILAAELMQNPDMGTDLGNGLHKVRMSIASKGKGKRVVCSIKRGRFPVSKLFAPSHFPQFSRISIK